jgi:hypothetical protein
LPAIDDDLLMKRLKICLINPKFEPSYWGFDYALPLYPGNIKSTMITGALPHLAGLIPNHDVCLIDCCLVFELGGVREEGRRRCRRKSRKKIDKAMEQAGQAMDKAKDSTKEAVIRTEAAARDAVDTAKELAKGPSK